MLNNHLKKWSRTISCALFCSWLTGNALFAQDINEAWVKANYTKREEMIPMRDGAHLYTAIYELSTRKSHLLSCSHEHHTRLLLMVRQ